MIFRGKNATFKEGIQKWQEFFFFERKNNRVVCIIEYFTGLLTYDLELTDTL